MKQSNNACSVTIFRQTQYKPWGEVRYQAGTTSTSYTYTGQYSNTADFGLMFYNARWYDSQLGRFAQADSIVPGGVQGYDRYAYVNNNPVRYVDPSGHSAWDGSNEGGGSGHSTCDLDCWRAKNPGDGDDGGGGGGKVSGLGRRPGHDYSAGPNPVCLNLSWIHCTDTEVNDYMARWQYPGQLFWNPVANNTSANVFPEKIGTIPFFGLLWPGSGAVYVTIEGNKFTNIAFSTHIFYTGSVERIWSRDANGTPYVTTHGVGTNDGYNFIDIHIGKNRYALGVAGPAIDWANGYVGPVAFTGVDIGLVTYTTLIETWQVAQDIWP